MKSLQIILISFLLFSGCFSPLIAQQVYESKLAFGVRLGANFDNLFFHDFNIDYWVLRSTPDLFIAFKNHEFQIGPAHTHFIKNPGWFYKKKFNPNAMGFSFGYRYYPSEILKRLRMFAEIRASRFLVKSINSSQSVGNYAREIVAWSGYTSLGVDYRIYQGFHTFIGAGIGITSTFTDYYEKIYPHVMVGIDYRFSANRK
jgi:opacity protein-like surface antigen